MKRNNLFCGFSALLLLLSASVSSCGETAVNEPVPDSKPAETQVTETEEAVLTDGLPDLDLDGFCLNFLNYDGTQYYWSLKTVAVDTMDGTLVNDAIYTRNAKVKDRFNADIKELQVDNVTAHLKQDVMAGDTEYQVAMVNDQQIMNCLTGGLLRMWNDLPYCRLDQPWWNADANATFRLLGHQYAAVGDFDLSEYSKSYLFYFNKDLYGTINSVSELYQTVKDGKWTQDLMLDLAKQYVSDLDGNGIYDEKDRFGISGYPKVVYQQFITGAGIKYVGLDNGRIPYFSLPTDERAISVIQKISGDYGATNAYLGSISSQTYMPMFAGGQIVFLGDTMWDTESYRAYPINIGMLPSPKWDENQENYCSITVGGVVCALPKTLDGDALEASCLLMEAMAYASRNDTLPVYKEVVLQGKYANDQESSDIIDIIFNTQTFDLGVTAWDIRDSIVTNIFDRNSTDVVSAVERIRQTADTNIAKAVKSVTEETEG